MLNIFLIYIGKLIVFISRILNLGSGSTWPGHIALSINKNFIRDILKTNDHRLRTILVAGTNGKTTTTKLIKTILEKDGKKVLENTAGANLLNGIASVLISDTNIDGEINKDFAILEIDENTLPLILKEITSPDFVVILNLFRDQLDRYGELNTIAKKWGNAIQHLPSKTTLILSTDDPQIAYLGLRLKGANVKYFGLNDKDLATSKDQHASDSTYCPHCGSKLSYSSIYYSHLGIWKCPKCNAQRPKPDQDNSPIYPLPGTYNRYNTIAATLVTREIGIKENTLKSALQDFKPAFGRQEILDINGKKVQIFLSKNPTSFNESLRTISSLRAKNLLIVLNDRIPDGRDVSWIWDVDFEELIAGIDNITVSGDRTYDMALRLKYVSSSQIKNEKLKIKNSLKISNLKFKIEENLQTAISSSLEQISKSETLYILPTYSAMLEVRKILTGKKIL